MDVQRHTAPNFAAEVDEEMRDDDGRLLYGFTQDVTWPDGHSLEYGSEPHEIAEDNARRAHWAFTSLQTFVSETYGGDADAEPMEQVVSDLVADLRHLSDAFGLDWAYITHRADADYDAEIRGEF